MRFDKTIILGVTSGKVPTIASLLPSYLSGVLLLVSSSLFAPLHADTRYLDDGTATDIYSLIFSGEGCTGCHAGLPIESCTNTAVQNYYLGNSTTLAAYPTIAACLTRIRGKVAASTASYPSIGHMPGVRMPQGGPFLNSTQQGYLSTWDSNGEPFSPPTVSTSTATAISKTGATLRGTFDPNVWSGTSVPGTYRFNYGLTTGYGSTTSAVNITGTSGVLRSTAIGGLTCGTTYNFRGRVTNGAATVNGLNRSFSTSACTNPVITQGASTAVMMSEDSVPTPFSLTLNATDDDPGTLNWTIFSGASNGTAGIAGGGTGTSEPISYTPNLNYVGMDSFQVRVSNATTGLSDTITVNVTINQVNDPPIITEGAGPVARTMDEDSSPTAFSLTLNATDLDTAAGSLIWSISGAASNGTAGASGSGLSKAITYTPNPDYNGGDSFTVQVFDGASPDTITVNVTIDPRNDAPVITAVGAQTGTEGSLVTITPAVVDPDDPNNGSGALNWSFVSGQQAGMNISNTGVITWIPPLGPPAVFNQMYPITIQVADGLEHGSLPDSDSFTLEIDPPDTDSDLIANYDDLCLTVADATNADNDGDGTPGSDGGADDGGDVCDLDDDNDGMSDIDEATYFFDPFDASDALQDADGDGLTNLFEITNGSNPWFGDLGIDATGYLTAFALPPAVPSSVHPQATTAVADDYGPYRPGRHVITWTGGNSVTPNLGTSQQTLDVRPLINFAADQQLEEGSTAMVEVIINGDAPVYPVTVDYSVTGTATAIADYLAPTPASGSLVFNDTTPQLISFGTVAIDGADAGETVVFSIDSASNAAIGSNAVHTVTLVEANVAPTASLQFTQGGDVLGSTYAGDGAIDIDALVSDINAGQTASYDWSGTDNALLPPGNVASWQVAAPVAGNYLIDLLVTDDGTPARSTRVTRILHVATGSAPGLGGGDSDNDTLADNNPLEGYADDDDDGIPNYLDANSNGASESNLIPDQTVNMTNSFLLVTEPGLEIARGSTAQAAGSFGTLLTDSEISQFGSVTGGAPLGGVDSFDHVGGIYDFEVRGLIPGASARVVIPLLSGIPRNAEYRKFNPASGWGGFVVNGANGLASAPGVTGACPEPGSSAYRNGLNYLDNCLQLRVQDGGPNDTDNSVNGVVTDPGTIGVRLTEPEIEEVEEGGGRMSPLMLVLLLLLTVVAGWRQLRGLRSG